jgi:arsenite methyltransferase
VADQGPAVRLREQVREHYAAAATAVTATGTASCCDGCDPSPIDTAQPVLGAALYPEAERHLLPAEAVAASLGCGNPVAVADLHPGETVLDLGCGGGIDVLLSARRVGPTGKAYGLDMTDEMLTLACRNAEQAGAGNVEFLKGDIEAIPLPTGTVDVVISNYRQLCLVLLG